MRALLPKVSLLALALPAAAPVLAAAAPVVALRLVLWGGHRTLAQVFAELALWGAGLAAWTWQLERPLLRELRGYLRGASPVASLDG